MVNQASEKYRKVAEECANRLVTKLGDEVEAIVLYGSVARGTAREESDIDLLVVVWEPDRVRKAVQGVCYDYDFERGFDVMTSVMDCDSYHLKLLVRVRSPFLSNVLRDGVVLHDDGAFAAVCREAVTVSA